MVKYVRKYWYWIVLAPLFMFGEVLMDLLQPQLMSVIVDDGVLGIHNNNVGDISIVINEGLKMICLVLIGALCGILSGVFANLGSQKFSNDLRKDTFTKIMTFSFADTDRFSTGSLVTRVTNDVTQVQNMVGMLIRGCVRTMLLFCGGIVCMLLADLRYGIVVFCALPIVFLIAFTVLRRANPLFTILQKKLDRVNSVVQENVAGSRVVKAYVKEDYEKERFAKVNQELVDNQLRVLVLFAVLTPLMNIVMNLVTIFVIKISSIDVDASGITPGEIIKAITYVSQILNGIMQMIMISQNISRGLASKKRIEEVLSYEAAIEDGELAGRQADTSEQNGKIEFRNVSVSYPNSSADVILKNINLTIHPGETLGILGATGSGKSSLVNLIPRFYDATEGEVLVDDVNVRAYSLHELREKVAIVLQKSELFSRSIRDNILWGNRNADESAMEQAAKLAQAEEFIISSPEGYDRIVAEQGMSLSGGQKQRLSISRAILRDSEILIFDDSTSALDLKTEAKLYDCLKESRKDTTKVIIAQRIASVKGANRIAVLDAGQLIACDSHERLMETCEVYQDIYNSQLKGGVVNE